MVYLDQWGPLRHAANAALIALQVIHFPTYSFLIKIKNFGILMQFLKTLFPYRQQMLALMLRNIENSQKVKSDIY